MQRRFGIVLLACQVFANAQDGLSAGKARSIDVTMQLFKDGLWKATDARTVLHANDEIRFQVQTSFSGYLYVFNVNSSGEGARLFPRPDHPEGSRVEAGPTYVVPGLKGVFVVGGQPGFDTTYWILSPTPLVFEEPSRARPNPSAPSTLRPRCREQELKARGLCVDDRAGAGPLKGPENLPAEARLQPDSLISRELTFRNEKGPTRITAPNLKGTGVIVYEFRIAHD